MNIKDLKPGSYTVVASSGQATPQQKTPFVNKVANFFGAKGITEQFGADIARAKAPEAEKGFVEYPTQKEVIGSAIQSGANLLPGAGKGLGLLTKTAVGAGTGYALDVGSKLQSDKPVEEALKPSVGTTVGGAIPVAGAVVKPATRVVSRLLKGLGSGLSGVSTDTIDKIVSNPRAAQFATEKIAKSGNAKVLEENARQVMNGISTIKQEARKAYGEGVEALAAVDINPATFRARTQATLDKYGVAHTPKGMQLNNVEFTDPKNIQKATELIKKLNTTDLDGKSLRKLSDDFENARYKIATGDEKLAFNAFTQDLSATLQKAINDSTDKLKEINKKFSSDMQLAQAVESIFGKTKFKNLTEVVRTTKRLENLFAQKGIAPEVIDDFLNRVGISPEDFKTGEAVRQISNKTSGANAKGLSFGEITQQFTSSIVTPQAVRDIATKIGVAEQELLPELQKLSPSIRKAVLNFLVQANQ